MYLFLIFAFLSLSSLHIKPLVSWLFLSDDEMKSVQKCDALFILNYPQRLSGALAVHLQVLAQAKIRGKWEYNII